MSRSATYVSDGFIGICGGAVGEGGTSRKRRLCRYAKTAPALYAEAVGTLGSILSEHRDKGRHDDNGVDNCDDPQGESYNTEHHAGSSH